MGYGWVNLGYTYLSLGYGYLFLGYGYLFVGFYYVWFVIGFDLKIQSGTFINTKQALIRGLF